ncbi:Splicing factor, suppressor of white-apricot -like protein [Collichthys lucidus]|uniref:Splicing factor, suppressor of white-apricot homolog n=1 Tax=Collichthys lucidus TaxID=240159 RepID=A0A4U5V900_COLLU|nr:Splicing factor, suppressor of white-apricot -like protein [Collichthys lucidus]
MYRRGAGKKDHNNKPVKKDVSDSDKYADLLVFGYACKLFPDDERALYHEHGKHLIPWMGDKSIMIDRYDGRGHLHDLSEYDSGSWNTSYQLSEEEDRIEALCDEERYLALHTDLLEEEARQEEEYKRLSEALADEGSYNAVAFKYSADYYDPSQPTEEEDANRETEEAEPEESEEPFVAPPGLAIPPDVELPATIKTHNIIERTANFVCQQGAQFEIVLKAKQASNSQFDFLRFDHYLNPYYKHILRAMKEGRYNLVSASKQEQSQDSHSDDSDEDGDGSYLHPSLFAPKKCSRLEELVKPLKVMDPDHPLAALVRKARQEKNGTAAMTTKPEEVADPAASGTPAQYTTDPNAAAMYYGYYMLPDGTFCLAPPPPGIDASSYYNTMPSAVMAPPTSSGAMPNLATTPTPSETAAMAPPATAPSQITSSAVPVVVPEPSLKPQAQVSTQAPQAIIPPPPDIQPVIDKLAEYVARNGLKFEASVRAKNDPRFDFLQSWHQYNTYYEFKKNYFMQKEGKCLLESEAVDDDDDNLQSDASLSESRLTKGCTYLFVVNMYSVNPLCPFNTIFIHLSLFAITASFAPICFAIKAKENDMLPLEKNRVRLDDDSDEDKLLEEQGLEAVMDGVNMPDKEPPPISVAEEKRPSLSLEELEAKQATSLLLSFLPLAKQKLEDRLAAAAREKLAQASKESKEKQLQAERKRKAALFLQTLRGPFAGEPEAKRAELDASAQLERIEDSYKKSPKALVALLRTVMNYPAHTPRGEGTGGAPHQKRDVKRENGIAIIPAVAPACPGGIRDPGKPNSRCHGPWSPPDKKRSSLSSSGQMQPVGPSLSPYCSPSRVLSPSASPASSLTHSRGGSLEKDKAVSSSIVSSVQSKITQDLMAKVRAMLATSKTFHPPNS